MHHLACHYSSKFQTKLTTFWGILAKKTPQKQPKMSYSRKKYKQKGGRGDSGYAIFRVIKEIACKIPKG